jgi:hypothetical protein
VSRTRTLFLGILRSRFCHWDSGAGCGPQRRWVDWLTHCFKRCPRWCRCEARRIALRTPPLLVLLPLDVWRSLAAPVRPNGPGDGPYEVAYQLGAYRVGPIHQHGLQRSSVRLCGGRWQLGVKSGKQLQLRGSRGVASKAPCVSRSAEMVLAHEMNVDMIARSFLPLCRNSVEETPSFGVQTLRVCYRLENAGNSKTRPYPSLIAHLRRCSRIVRQLDEGFWSTEKRRA